MNSTKLFSKGARLVWRHQRIAWWIFAVNLILGWLAIGGVRNALAPILDHSAASQRLVEHFDLAACIELFTDPSVPIQALVPASMHFALIFLLYMIFIDGGILTVYREDRKLTIAEFFEMSGGYFWRMFRLVLISLIPFAIVAGLMGAVSGMSGKIGDNALNDRVGFYVLVGGGFIVWLIFLTVRAWFDLGQCMTVARDDRGMWRNSWRSLVMTLRGLGTLLATYVCIHIVGIVAMMALMWTWLHVPHAATPLSLLILELLLGIEIAVRLWQKAACMTWLESQSVAVSAPVYEPTPIAAEPGTLPQDASPNPGESEGI